MMEQSSLLHSTVYRLNPKHFAALFYLRMARKYWFITAILVGMFAIQVIYASTAGTFPGNLIFPLFFLLVFFYLRWRVISKFKHIPGIFDERVFTVFPDRIDFESGSNGVSSVPFNEIAEFKRLRKDYQLVMTDTRVVWFPLSAVADRDRALFETTLTNVCQSNTAK